VTATRRTRLGAGSPGSDSLKAPKKGDSEEPPGAVPPGLEHSIAPAMSGEASLYRVRDTDDPAGPTHWA